MTVYLDFDTVAEINLEHGGPGAGVRDREGIEAAIARPYSSGFGQDLYPDVWSKAAAYLHGLSSTQYFHDGNKRTAWLVTVIFLKENRYRFPQVDDVEAEAFVLTVAKDLFSNPDEPDRTVEMAAEWLRLRWHGSPSGGIARQAWAVLAIRAQSTENEGVYDVEQLGLATLATPSVPAVFRVALFTRIFYGPEDVGRPHHLDVAVEHQRYPFVQLGPREFPMDLTPPVASGHPHHLHGILPTYVSGTLLLDIQGEGTTRLVVSLDGKLLVKVPLTIKVVPGLYVDDDDVPDWLLAPRRE